jgi:methionyl-tRNA formyltransferase
MGSPEFAVPTLEAVAPRHDIVLVVCQPDKPAGRGQTLTPPAVKSAAARLGLSVFQPAKLRPPEVVATLAAAGADVAVVVAYGKILPPSILALPRLGCLNVHGSLLPKYRGAAPIQWALMRGEHETGITIMKLDEGMDTGPTLVARAIPIGDDDTAGSLSPKLAALGAELMVETLDRYTAHEPPPAVAQDHAAATMAPMLEKATGRIDWSRPAREVSCLIRGVDPWPGAYTELLGASSVELLKVWTPRRAEGHGPPGTVLGVDAAGLVVACGDGALTLGELQLPSRKRLSAQAVLAGRPLPPGTRLGGPW